jgi:hypothetical protein
MSIQKGPPDLAPAPSRRFGLAGAVARQAGRIRMSGAGLAEPRADLAKRFPLGSIADSRSA